MIPNRTPGDKTEQEAVNWWNDELSINEQKRLMAAHLRSYECTYFGEYKPAHRAKLIAKMYAAHSAIA